MVLSAAHHALPTLVCITIQKQCPQKVHKKGDLFIWGVLGVRDSRVGRRGLLQIFVEWIIYFTSSIKQGVDSWKSHWFMKRQIRPGLRFGSYPTACNTIQGYEVMHMIRKGQMEGIEKGNIRKQNQFIMGLFGIVG